MPQKIQVIYVLSPQISYDTKEQARTFDTLVLFVPYNEPYLFHVLAILAKALVPSTAGVFQPNTTAVVAREQALSVFRM